MNDTLLSYLRLHIPRIVYGCILIYITGVFGDIIMKKDLFTESARIATVGKRLRDSFESWGYNEIFLPSIVKYEGGLRKGLRMATHDDYFLVRPDVTSHIAVNVKDDRTLRLFYISEVLDGLSGEWQAGMEFIGGEREDVSLEILRMVVECLDKLGIDDYYMDIGSLKFWLDAIADIPEHREVILQALKQRNFGIIEELHIQDGKTEELWELFNFRGRKCGNRKIDRMVEDLDDDRIFIDFGTVRPLPYYDDIIVEVYSPDLGYPLGAGGDYRVNGLDAFGFAFRLKGLVELSGGDVP